MQLDGRALPVFDAAAARILTDRIKIGVESIWRLVTEAYQTRVWVVLGYSSWDDYCTQEFGASRLRLPREERQEVVASLRESGLSIRAIVSATGYADQTVQRDLKQASQITTPEAHDPKVVVEAIDAESDNPTKGFDPELVGLLRGLEDIMSSAKPPAQKITGTDGKSYKPKAASTKPRRSSLPDAAQRAGWDFRKAVERLERIAEDDRFSANKEQVAAHLSGHLLYAIEICQDLAHLLAVDDLSAAEARGGRRGSG